MAEKKPVSEVLSVAELSLKVLGASGPGPGAQEKAKGILDACLDKLCKEVGADVKPKAGKA